MKKKCLKNRGQFSIIAALLVAVVLVTVLVTTYSIVRNSPFGTPPKVLGAIDEMNLAIKKTLEFTVGYYGSILQVTGNITYAKSLAVNYLYSGLVYIANIHPEWSPSFLFNYSNVNTKWFEPTSRSGGNISVTYSLQGMGVTNIKFATSCELNVAILSANATHTRIKVTKEDATPVLALTQENFNFYSYNYAALAWDTVNPSSLLVFSNGTYVVNIPSGVDPAAYMIQVADTRGIMVAASRTSYYSYALTWNSTRYSSLNNDVIVVEALQNGTLRWLGQNLKLTTQGRPLPPIPVRSLRVNQTIDGVNREVPFQVEDWGSEYRVPLGISSNASVFSNKNMLVFLLNHRTENVRIWWDGRDTAVQTSYATTNRYFTNDDWQNGVLTNGILTLRIGKGIEHLYVNNYDGTYTNWSTSGSSPYLNDDPANNIFTSRANFGYETKGGSSDSTENYIRGYKALCQNGGNVTSITAYLYVSSTQKKFRAAIYSTSYNRIAQTQELTLAAGTDRWVTFYFTAPYPQVSTGTEYWLVVWGESASGSGLAYYDSGPSNVGLYQSRTYDSAGFPASFTPDGLQSRKYSIYANLGDEGWFGFADAYDTSGSVGQVKIEFEGKSDGDDYFNFRVNDGSTTYGPYNITGLSSNYGWKSYNLSSVLNSWTKINNAKFYVSYKQQGATASPVYIRRARLVVETSLSGFIVTSTLGTSSAKAEFMRVNNQKPTYGSGKPAYVIHHGIIRDIVQQEAEYQGGVSGCPNFYSQLVVMLPANATYYTYALRTIFVNSSQSRTISDLSAIQLYISCANTMWGSGWGQTLAENGTSSGLPITQTISSTTKLFYNFTSTQTGWAHHWSEFVKNNNGGGVMFTNASNFKLYAFDKIAGAKTGALNVTDSLSGEYQNIRIEVNPVERFSASFQTPLDLTWYGAVVNFEGTDPIYPTAGGYGLWVIVENPPTITIS
jgi:hypothetical protein